MHRIALEAGDVAARPDLAVTDEVEEVGVERRVGGEQAVPGLLEPVARVAPQQEAEQKLEAALAQPRRTGAEAGVEDVGGQAEQELRNYVIAAAHAEVGAGGVAAGLDGDVAGRVAAADDQHPKPGVGRRRLEIVGVQETSGEGARVVGEARLPVVAVGHQEMVEELGLTARQGDAPAPVAVQGRVLDLALEADVVLDAEAPGIGLEVGLELGVAGVVRVVGGHGEVVVLGQALRRDDVGGLEDAGVRRLGVEDPVAADLGVTLVDHQVGETGADQVLGGGDARRPGADHAEARRRPGGASFPGHGCRGYFRGHARHPNKWANNDQDRN